MATKDPSVSSTQSSHTPNIIVFDLDGVLLSTSRWQAARYVISECFFSILYQSLFYGNIQKRFFDFMDTVDNDRKTECIAYDPKGPALPAMMHNWLAGYSGYTSHELIDKLIREIASSSQLADSTRCIFRSLVKTTFDPSRRASFTHIMPEGRYLLEKLQETYPQCTFAILSNYDKACFHAVKSKEETDTIFRHFKDDHIFISGKMGTHKPCPTIFHQFCKEHGVEPEACIFIDDQEVNTQAAKNIGMHAIQFDPSQHKSVFYQIQKLIDGN